MAWASAGLPRRFLHDKQRTVHTPVAHSSARYKDNGKKEKKTGLVEGGKAHRRPPLTNPRTTFAGLSSVIANVHGRATPHDASSLA